MKDKFLEIKKAKNGQGVFAKMDFEKDEVVLEVTGNIVHYKKLWKDGGLKQDNSFRFSLNYYMTVEESFAKYLNHSCDPNLKVVKDKKRLFMVSLHHISKGEELVFDYSTILAADDIWTMNCNCGSLKCRKKIQRYIRLPKKLKEYYIQEEIIPSYILKFPYA